MILLKICLQTDWSRDGIGYLLQQQHCNCTCDKAPVCCKEDWKLIYAGSRFTYGTESKYSPTKSEVLAVSWSLEHSNMFTLGYNILIVSTDHHPLFGVFGNNWLILAIHTFSILKRKPWNTISQSNTIQGNGTMYQMYVLKTLHKQPLIIHSKTISGELLLTNQLKLTYNKLRTY